MLSDAKIKNAKPAESRYRMADFDGLYLEVMQSGKKYWRYRYTKNGKRHWYTIGEYPVVRLPEARELRDKAKRDLFEGIAPGTQEAEQADTTFETVALEWLVQLEARSSSAKDRQTVRSRLIHHIFPFIGHVPINEIKATDVLALVRRLEAAGTIETAHRVQQICGRVFRYGVASGVCERDPSADIKGAIMPMQTRHFVSITDTEQVGALMRSIDAYPQRLVRLALQFSALVFCRPGEIRHAEWSEVKDDEWRIPGEKMKMRRPHIVPLSTQAIEVLRQAREMTGHGKYIFPSNRAPHGDRPMSENTALVALRSMGYGKDQMTAHGFRSMASTLLNENGFNRDWIERQLAHIEGNSVRAAYNYAEYLPERRKMMQWWADYLDKLKGE